MSNGDSDGDKSLQLALVAGETSGDLLGGLLLGGLKARWPALQASGIGGPRMLGHGFNAEWKSDQLAVRGYVEVLAHYRRIAAIRRALAQRLLAERPDAFIGIDAPDFNLGLEAQLRKAGIKTVHFISPSIWAWRGKRLDAITRAVDLMLCVFPFEPALYAKRGIEARYVGHPLADVIPLDVPRSASRQALGLSDESRVVALLPGSRRSEIESIAPLLLAAAAELQRQRPGLRFLLPAAPGLRSLIEPLLAAHAGGAAVTLLDGRSHEALAACDVALVASGTATLEAALFKRPMVITYRMHWLSWQLMKRRAYLPWVGLPNILLNDSVVPERVQEAATPKALACAALDWLDDPARCAALAARFHTLHQLLRRNTAQAATDAIGQLLGR